VLKHTARDLAALREDEDRLSAKSIAQAIEARSDLVAACCTTLLHNIAEILMWCFSPDQMLKIRDIQQHDKSLRSRSVQEQVLGFALDDLQTALVKAWALPELLLTMMDAACARQTRVHTVTLAINLARHSANGWDDAALPDDYKELGELLHLPTEQAMSMVVADSGQARDANRPH
jgi:HD-like signal output (HDOD) protein